MNNFAHASSVPHSLHASDFIIAGIIVAIAVVGIAYSLKNKD